MILVQTLMHVHVFFMRISLRDRLTKMVIQSIQVVRMVKLQFKIKEVLQQKQAIRYYFHELLVWFIRIFWFLVKE